MKALIQALSKARLEFSPLKKNGRAQGRGGREYKYALLDDIIEATAGPLAKHGLHVYHSYAMTPGQIKVICHLTDGEHELTSEVEFPLQEIQGNPAQAIGTYHTYGRRYSMQALLNICSEEDDDAVELTPESPKRDQPRPSPIKPQDAEPARQVAARVSKQQQVEWLNRKFDEYGLSIPQRERILSEAPGKTMAQIIQEIESARSEIII